MVVADAVVHIFLLIFLITLVVCAAMNKAQIHDSCTSLIGNDTVLMSVTYTKPENMRTEWRYYKPSRALIAPRSFPMNYEEQPTIVEVNTTNGSYTETLELDFSSVRSGDYTFRIWDPANHQAIETVNFTLQIPVAPNEVTLRMVGVGQPRNLQWGQIYNFACSTIGYPLPNITWQFSSCLDHQRYFCKDDWTSVESSIMRRNQLDSSYYREQQINLKAYRIGKLRCVAENTKGMQMSTGLQLIPSDVKDTEVMSGLAIYYTYNGDQFSITCQMQKSEFFEFVRWVKKFQNGTEYRVAFYQRSLDPRLYLFIDRESSKFTNKHILKFLNLTNTDAGDYTCLVQDRSHRDHSRTITLTEPTITYPDGNDIQIGFVPNAPLSLSCKVGGIPRPKVSWYKNGKLLDASQNSNIAVKPDFLEFMHTSQSDKGEYECEATNGIGTVRKRFHLRAKIISDWNQTVTVLVSVIGSILLLSLLVILRMAMLNIRGRQQLVKLEIMLKSNEQTEFDPTLPIFENIDKGPKINPNYQNCLKVDTLIIDRRKVVMLGEGNFGVVLQVKHRKSDGSMELLALKRPKCNFEVDQYVMLYKEICLMTFLGKHPNIVNMFGFINDISHGQLYLVMELCTDGSLENLLKSVRLDFDRKFFSELRNLYQNVPGGNRYLQEDFPDWPLIKAAHKGYIFHSDLISYAYQVALAMEYLAQLSFVHRDLAARNILLGNNFKVAKIGDFGLGRQIYSQKYKFFDKQKNLKLPLRWTAPESLIFKEFSRGSDVWSFGVLIGEIFSLGEIPFSHVPDNQFDPNKLLSGEITPKRPFLASDNIYQLMLNCCEPQRQNRINFTEAKSKLREEFERCSPDQLVSLEAFLSEIRQQLEVSADSIEADSSV